MKSKKIIEEIRRGVDAGYNILLVGEAGVGKTAMIKEACKGLIVAYYSGAGMDPITDVIGIPVPNPDGNIKYCRPDIINKADVIFVDEANRIHPRVASALFEIMVGRTILGSPTKIKSVIGAVNPITEAYHVEEMDRALRDRFSIIIPIPYELPEDYFGEKYGKDIAEEVVAWWESLGHDAKAAVTPRRLESMIDAHLAGLNMELFVPVDEKLRKIPISLSRLRDILENASQNLWDAKYQAIIRKKIAEGKDITFLVELATRTDWGNAAPDKIAEVLDIVAAMPGDIIRSIFSVLSAEKMNRVTSELLAQHGKEKFTQIMQEINQKVQLG